MVGPRLTKRIVVVGDIVTDVVARHSGPLHVGSDSTAIVASYGGGSAANVAAWLAADSAAPVSYVGRIGDDAAGRAQVAELQRAGVDVRVGIDTEHCTGCVVVLVDSSGQRTMLPDRGANSFLSPADLPHELFAAGCHMHLSGYPLLHESSRAAALTALDLARGADMTVSIDPASAAPLAALGAQRFRRWTAGARLCIANLDEAAVLAGTDRAAAGDGVAIALELASAAYREVVVKLGADGAIWSDGSSVAAVPSVPARVVDTTGAGDAFAAGFLAAWTAGATPHDALSAGVTLAAVAVATPGARPLLQNSPAANSPR